MARAARLKVYRTPMGFYDAVVAAPSQAAALKAWGLSANLFSEGLAEEVKDDPALLAEASETPGVIVRKPRGDQAELMARAAPASRKSGSKAAKTLAARRLRPSPPDPKPDKPSPDRAPLEAAEKALKSAQAELEAALKTIEERRRDLDAEELRVRRDGDRTIQRKRNDVDAERRRFEAAS